MATQQRFVKKQKMEFYESLEAQFVGSVSANESSSFSGEIEQRKDLKLLLLLPISIASDILIGN